MQVIFLCITFLSAPELSAQETSFNTGFNEGFAVENPPAEADNFPADKAAKPEPHPLIEWGGYIKADLRACINEEDPARSEIHPYPEIGLDLINTAEKSQAVAEVRFHRNWDLDTPILEQDIASQNISWYLQRMINQAYLQLFYDRFNMKVGFFKVVWGTGDQSHVADPLNPFDYFDFVNNDYLERKVSQFMGKLDIPFALNGLIEIVYVPVFTPDYTPLSGRWMPSSTAVVSDALLYSAVPPEIVRPETNLIHYSQFAARFSRSHRGFDFGSTYYYGFTREPNLEITGGPLPAAITSIELSYDRLHLIGLDTAFTLGGFNIRGEIACYLGNDVDGIDENRENNQSIQYVAGWDRNLRVHNLSLHMQCTGAYYFDEFSDPQRNVISAALKDDWYSRRVCAEVSASYGVENDDWMVRPTFEFSLPDGILLSLEYVWFSGDEEGIFGQFEENDFFEISLTRFF